jgi:hypothetical protein
LSRPRDQGGDSRPTREVENVLARRDHVSALASVALTRHLGLLVRQRFARSEELVLELIPTLLLIRHGDAGRRDREMKGCAIARTTCP